MSAAAVPAAVDDEDEMEAFQNLLRSADGVPVLDYEDPKRPVAADLRLENDRLVLRRERRARLWRLRRKRQPVERALPLKQVVFASASTVVEKNGCFWIVGAKHTRGDRIIDCKRWRLALSSANPPPIDDVLDYLQPQGKFDNKILTNFVPTEVSNLASQIVDLVGFGAIGTPIVKAVLMCVATVETVQGITSDFITLVQHWIRVRENLHENELLGRAITHMAEDFFFKSDLRRGLASKDFAVNLKRLNERAGKAIDATLLELASDQNSGMEELQAGVDEILRILWLARDAVYSLRSLGILAAVAIAVVLSFAVPGVSHQVGADTLQTGMERVQTGVEQLQAGFEELLQLSRTSVVAFPILMFLVISSASILYCRVDKVLRQTTSHVEDKKFDWMTVKSMLPQSRLFMGREDELRTIREHVERPLSITSLVGVAGCGKSHLAREAAYQWSKDAKENEHRIVLFASVANEESYVSYLLKIMKTIGLEPVFQQDGKPVPTAELSKRIHERLAEAPSNVQVLWILDNAPVSANGPDLLHAWFGPAEDRSWSNLRVILTSQSTAYSFTTRLGEIEMMQVNPLPTDVSLALLTKTFPRLLEQEDEKKAATELIIEYLHNLPVAILAVAPLAQKWTFCGYLRRFRERKVTAGADSVREVLQDALAKARRDASLARVLDVAAFVSPDNIPLSLLGDDEELVEQLCTLNLLQIVMDDHYSMHGLIQAAARFDRSPRDAIVALDDALDSYQEKSHDTWPAAVALLPHFEALHRVANVEYVLVELSNDDLKVFSGLLHNCGMVYTAVLCKLEQSRSLYEECLRLERAVYGATANNASIAHTLNNLGSVFSNLGEYEQAKNYYEQALAMKRAVYGVTANHASIAGTLNNLGSVYYDLGQYDRAKDYYEQALAMYRAVYGVTSNHGEVAITLNNLGVVYKDLGQYEQAKDYYDQALAMYRAVYGVTANHADIASSLLNLGLVYYNLGQYERAKDYYEQALAMRRAVYGATANNAEIADTLNNMGNVYDELGEYERAKDYHEQALAMRRAVYGVTANNADVASTLLNLGVVYVKLGDYELARDYHEQALNMFQVVYQGNESHPHIQSCLRNLQLLSQIETLLR